MQYGEGGKNSVPLFYRRFNDIDFFVEDEGNEYFYRELLSQLLGEDIKVSRVFALGGKSKILKRFRDYKRSGKTTSEFYILDGDFDELLGSKINDDNLYYLDEYCIENYLLEEEAVCIILKEESPENSIEDFKEKIKFKDWLIENVNKLAPLYACYFYIQDNIPGQENTGKGVKPFFCNQTKKVKADKINNFIDFIGGNYTDDFEEFRVELENIVDEFGENWKERKKYIDGKELLFLLKFFIIPYTYRSIDNKSLKFRMLKHSSLDGLSDLSSKVNIIMG